MEYQYCRYTKIEGGIQIKQLYLVWNKIFENNFIRFHNGDYNPYRRAMIYKRADREGHLKDFNSVPFMGNEVHWTGWNAQFLILGKRSEERGDTGVKSGEGVMVRRPRYIIEDYDEEVDQDGFNPWAFFDLEAQIQNELIWNSNEANFFCWTEAYS